MPKYRALCLYQGKGRPTVKVVDAETPEAAAAALTIEGWLVGKVEEVAATRPSPAPATPDPVLSAQWPVASEPATASTSWLADFFAFRVMIVPGLVRVGFLLETIGAIIMTVVIVGLAVAALTGTRMSPRLSLFELTTSLVTIWAAWLGWRIAAEFLLVIFKINERAGDIARSTGGKSRVCRACGYDLRGLEATVCPECGAGV